MAIINLNPGQLFSADPSSEARWTNLAAYLNRRLTRAVQTLNDLDLYFEASDAEDLAEAFLAFTKEDGTAEGFVAIWSDLEDWAGGTAVARGREKTLCSLPNLPPEYAC